MEVEFCLTICHYLASSMMVFIPLIFSFRIRLRVCLAFLRDMAYNNANLKIRGIVMKAWQHFKTITTHKLLVMDGCFKVGLYKQGLLHDLSKYSPTEFSVGVRYYQGTRSPNAGEREEKGYSEAWMHHKGRNRHHYEYWTDMSMATKRYESVPMPRKYLVEMVMDRRAACIVYQGEKYTDASALNYYLNSKERYLMHPKTQRELEYILTMLRDEGEDATFDYIRRELLGK